MHVVCGEQWLGIGIPVSCRPDEWRRHRHSFAAQTRRDEMRQRKTLCSKVRQQVKVCKGLQHRRMTYGAIIFADLEAAPLPHFFQRTFQSSGAIPITAVRIYWQFPIPSSMVPSLIHIWLDVPGTGGKVLFQLVVALWLKHRIKAGPQRRDEKPSLCMQHALPDANQSHSASLW